MKKAFLRLAMFLTMSFSSWGTDLGIFKDVILNRGWCSVTGQTFLQVVSLLQKIRVLSTGCLRSTLSRPANFCWKPVSSLISSPPLQSISCSRDPGAGRCSPGPRRAFTPGNCNCKSIHVCSGNDAVTSMNLVNTAAAACRGRTCTHQKMNFQYLNSTCCRTTQYVKRRSEDVFCIV